MIATAAAAAISKNIPTKIQNKNKTKTKTKTKNDYDGKNASMTSYYRFDDVLNASLTAVLITVKYLSYRMSANSLHNIFHLPSTRTILMYPFRSNISAMSIVLTKFVSGINPAIKYLEHVLRNLRSSIDSIRVSNSNKNRFRCSLRFFHTYSFNFLIIVASFEIIIDVGLCFAVRTRGIEIFAVQQQFPMSAFDFGRGNSIVAVHERVASGIFAFYL